MTVPFDRRGLRFIQVFLQSICDGERDENHPNLIRVNANKAYEMALKKYHGWLVQKIFKVSTTGQDVGPPQPSLSQKGLTRPLGRGWSLRLLVQSWPTLFVAASAS